MEAAEEAKNFQEAIVNATGPKSNKDAAASNQPSLDELKASLKDALLEQKEAQEAQAMAAEGFFLLYANLLSEDARFHWDKIVSSQVRTAPTREEYGVLLGLHHLPPPRHVPQ